MPSSLNGTGVTFNDGSTLQSGNIPAANLGSGTANSTTFLRGDRTFATPPSQAPTTAQVLSATAGAAARAVGTYATAFSVSGTVGIGGTIAGSSLRGRTDFGQTTNPSFTGTWRAMGASSAADNTSLSIFLRIS